MKIFVDAYLYNNLGDDLFFETLIKRYPRHSFYAISDYYKTEIKNVTIYKQKISDKLLNTEKFKEKLMLKNMDMAIGLGGSLYINNIHNMGNDEPYSGKDYFLLNTNFGTFETEKYYKKYYDFFKTARDVCFRDEFSYSLFKSLPQVRTAPDILFDIDSKYKNVKNVKRAIISILSSSYKSSKFNEKYQKKMVQLIKFLKIQGYDVCLMSFCKYQGDEKAIESLLKKTDDEVEVYYYNGNINEALEILSNSNLIIGSRFHSIILGLAMEKTVIPLIFDKRTEQLLDQINFKGRRVDLSELDKFKVTSLTYYDLNYLCDITKVKEESKKQFTKLDKFLEKNTLRERNIDNRIYYDVISKKMEEEIEKNTND